MTMKPYILHPLLADSQAALFPFASAELSLPASRWQKINLFEMFFPLRQEDPIFAFFQWQALNRRRLATDGSESTETKEFKSHKATLATQPRRHTAEGQPTGVFLQHQWSTRVMCFEQNKTASQYIKRKRKKSEERQKLTPGGRKPSSLTLGRENPGFNCGNFPLLLIKTWCGNIIKLNFKLLWMSCRNDHQLSSINTCDQ